MFTSLSLLIISFMCLMLLLSAFFSASESALFSLSRAQLIQFRRGQKPAERRTAQLLDDPQKLLASILLGNMLVNILFASLSVVLIEHWRVQNVGLHSALGELFFLLLLILFGEILPKNLAIHSPAPFALWSSGPLQIFEGAIHPVRQFFHNFSKPLSAALSPDKPQSFLTEDEMAMLVELSAQEGHIDKLELNLIQEVVELQNTYVKELMTPRTDLVFYEAGSDIDDLGERLKKGRQTVVPVFRSSPDDADRFLPVKYALLAHHKKTDWKELKKHGYSAWFVPETKSAESFLRECIERKMKHAIVVDEYGGTAGLITLNDILDVLVEDLHLDGKPDEEWIRKIGPGAYVLNGQFSIWDWEDLFGLDLPDVQIETIGGFVGMLLGRLPKAGDQASFRNLRFTVEKTQRRRIQEVKLEVIEEANTKKQRG